jgi:hypothetical protein
MRQGKTPKRRVTKAALRVVSESDGEAETKGSVTATTSADPATVRPLLAAAAAENVEQLTASLLEAAGSAVKPVWLTVECSGCGARARIEAPMPDVRARVAAIELLLREGLGRPAVADDVRTPRLPSNAAAVREMGWAEMEALFAATYADEIAAVIRRGGKTVVREKLTCLSHGERRAMREALDELEQIRRPQEGHGVGSPG